MVDAEPLACDPQLKSRRRIPIYEPIPPPPNETSSVPIYGPIPPARRPMTPVTEVPHARPNGPGTDLGLLAVLVRNVQRRAEWLRRFSDHAPLFDAAFKVLGRLERDTDWDMDELLGQLGCDATSMVDIEALDEDEVRLRRCLSHLEWVEHLVQRARDKPAHARAVLVDAREFLDDAEHDLAAAQAALEHGPFSGVAYLHIGEIGAAWTVARRHLPGPVGQEARRRAARNPFIAAGLEQHLSAARLDAFLLGEYAAIGTLVFAQVHEHVRECDTCKSAARRRATELGLASAQTPYPWLFQATTR